MRIVSGVAAKAGAVMPLILAGLLPLVSLAGVMTMRGPATADHSGMSHEASIASDAGGESPAGRQADDVSEGKRLDDELLGDEGPPYDNPGSDATGLAPGAGGDDSGAPGKSEEATGQPETSGRGEGRGQEKADQNGQGPTTGRDNTSTSQD